MGSAGYLCAWICAVGDGVGRSRMWAGIVDGTVYGVGFWIEGNE